jgi:hypothetical protein
MTGRYPQRFGYEAQPTDDETNPLLGLPAQEILLPQLLKPAGYVCGAFGKWHLGQATNLHPIARGFDEFYGFLTASAQPGYYSAHLLRGDTPVTEPDYLTDAFTREAVAFINHHATEPFFLYLPYNAVHAPYDQPPDVYMQRVAYIPDPKRQNYAAMVVALDDGIGQILQTLRDNNILDNTFIFFLSDNGGPPLDSSVTIPFGVTSSTCWKEGFAFPLPCSGPGISASGGAALSGFFAGHRSDDCCCRGCILTDRPGLRWHRPHSLSSRAAATPAENLILALARFRSRWPVRLPRTRSGPARQGPFKLVVERAKDDQARRSLQPQHDIGETNDLASNYPAKVASLQGLFAQWTLNTMAPLWQDGSHLLPRPLNLTGDWDGFNINDTSLPWMMTRITAPSTNGTPDGFNLFSSLVHVATSGGDYYTWNSFIRFVRQE